MLDMSRFTEFADSGLNVFKLIGFAFERVENIMGKGENDGYQHFLSMPPH